MLIGSSACCGPRYIDGVSLALPDGAVARLSREGRRAKGEDPGLVAPGAAARFVLERPVKVAAASDLALRLSSPEPIASGTRLVVRAAAAEERFELPAGRSYELRVSLPAEATVGSVELESGSALGLEGLSIEPAFSGLRRMGDRLLVDAASSRALAATGGKALSLRSGAGLDASVIATANRGGRVTVLSRGGGGFAAVLAPGESLALPLEALGADIEVAAEGGLEAAYLEPGRGAPLADLHAALRLEPAGAAGYRLFRWDLLPGTLVFVFDDYSVQDRFLKRLAFFTEKPGFRGRVAGDEEIEALHGWNAHDYSTETLAAFFNAAGADRLNADELRLRDILLAWGLLGKAEDSGTVRYAGGRGAVMSVALETAPSLRRLFMDHEASHSVFFQDADYRALSARLYESLGPEALRFWRLHLAWRNYDITDKYLCVNELQAYHVQQGAARTRAYFEQLAERLAKAYPERAEAILADGRAAAEESERIALALDGFLRDRYGLSAGRMGRAVRVP